MKEIRPDEFRRLLNYVKDQYGINLTNKESLVTGRLAGVLRTKGMETLDEYLDYIKADKTGQEAVMLVNKLTTNYSYFYREESHFELLKERILPELDKTVTDHDIRTWSAGCSSGEEPYTTAMVIDEFFGARKKQWDCKILATDISQNVLDQAKTATYPADRLENLPRGWQQKYFRQLADGSYAVTDAIKNEVIFRVFNLMTPTFSFKRPFHVIFCRNVMIYFDRETRDTLIKKFASQLCVGGYLMIGHSETIGSGDPSLKFIMPSVYRKVRAG